MFLPFRNRRGCSRVSSRRRCGRKFGDAGKRGFDDGEEMLHRERGDGREVEEGVRVFL